MSQIVADKAQVDPSEFAEDVAAHIHAGNVAAAKRHARRMLDSADPDTLRLIELCARAIEHYPNTARTRMAHLWKTWTADEHRAIIAAFAPKNGEAPRHSHPKPEHAPRWDAATRAQAPRDERSRRVDPRTLPALRSVRAAEAQLRTHNVTTDYDDTRAGVEEITPDYRDRRTAFDALPTAEPAPGYTIDYDRAAMHALRGLPCLVCFMERAVTDYRHPTTDDALCGECRDRGHQGLTHITPPRNRTDVLIARCAYIAERKTPVAAHAILKQEWRRAGNTEARDVIARWVGEHFTIPEPDAEPTNVIAWPTNDPDAPLCGTCGSYRAVRGSLCADCRALAIDDDGTAHADTPALSTAA